MHVSKVSKMAIINEKHLERTLYELGTYLRFELQPPRLATDRAPYHLCICTPQNSSGEREFVDDLTLDVHELNCAVQAESSASSSACPSVGEWTELFRLADKTICMPISEGVSEATMPRPPHVTWCLPRSRTVRFIWLTREPQVAKWI